MWSCEGDALCGLDSVPMTKILQRYHDAVYEEDA